MLAREGEKDNDEVVLLFFLRLGWSQASVEKDEFQWFLEDWQGSSAPDGGGGGASSTGQNGERECFLESDFEPLCDVPRGVYPRV